MDIFWTNTLPVALRDNIQTRSTLRELSFNNPPSAP